MRRAWSVLLSSALADSDRDWFEALSDLIKSIDRRLSSAVLERDSSEETRAAWSDAASDLHDAIELLYGDLDLAIRKAKLGASDAEIFSGATPGSPRRPQTLLDSKERSWRRPRTRAYGVSYH